MEKHFAIIDIETTGGSPRTDKITEVGIVIHDGREIRETFQTLIHPERSIPAFITRITGISDEMVADAPKFYEVARQLVELTEDTVFVAHNARFDYGFFVEEFRRLGFTFARKTLCTVQMSRKAFPGLPSYSLKNLVRHFDIPLLKHHRALDDATAAAHIFERVLRSDYYTRVQPVLSRKNLVEQKLPAHLSKDKIDAIPDACGLYYFYGQQGELLYIGKSIHIRSRIYEHFADNSERAARLQAAVKDIDYMRCGNELAALLLENAEIKKKTPSFNKAQKQKNFPYCVAYHPTIGLEVLPSDKLGEHWEVLRLHTSRESARASLDHHLSIQGICACVRTLKSKESCIHARIGNCRYEYDLPPVEDRYESTLNSLRAGFDQDGLLSGPGRHADEHFVALILDKKMWGMGYIDNTVSLDHVERIMEYLEPQPYYPEWPALIRNYLKDHRDVVFTPLPLHQDTTGLSGMVNATRSRKST